MTTTATTTTTTTTTNNAILFINDNSRPLPLPAWPFKSTLDDDDYYYYYDDDDDDDDVPVPISSLLVSHTQSGWLGVFGFRGTAIQPTASGGPGHINDTSRPLVLPAWPFKSTLDDDDDYYYYDDDDDYYYYGDGHDDDVQRNSLHK